MHFSVLNGVQCTDKRHLKYQRLSFFHIDVIFFVFSVKGQTEKWKFLDFSWVSFLRLVNCFLEL